MKIEIKDLSHIYPTGDRALDGVNLQISGSEPVAIIGQNGAGKTTLVKHLNRILEPSDGEVLIDGVSSVEKPTSKWAQSIGYVFQNPDDQLFANTVEEELTFGPRQIGMTRAKVAERLAKVSTLVGLAKKLRKHPYDLTGTDKKFTTIGSVLMMNPQLVVLDEPTMGQDTRGTLRLRQIIRGLRAEGVLCLTISHDMKFVTQCFERVIVMSQGKVLLDDTTREVFSQPETLKQSFVVPPPVTQVAQAAGVEGTPLTVRELITSIEKKRNQQHG